MTTIFVANAQGVLSVAQQPDEHHDRFKFLTTTGEQLAEESFPAVLSVPFESMIRLFTPPKKLMLSYLAPNALIELELPRNIKDFMFIPTSIVERGYRAWLMAQSKQGELHYETGFWMNESLLASWQNQLFSHSLCRELLTQYGDTHELVLSTPLQIEKLSEVEYKSNGHWYMAPPGGTEGVYSHYSVSYQGWEGTVAIYQPNLWQGECLMHYTPEMVPLYMVIRLRNGREVQYRCNDELCLPGETIIVRDPDRFSPDRIVDASGPYATWWPNVASWEAFAEWQYIQARYLSSPRTSGDYWKGGPVLIGLNESYASAASQKAVPPPHPPTIALANFTPVVAQGRTHELQNQDHPCYGAYINHIGEIILPDTFTGWIECPEAIPIPNASVIRDSEIGRSPSELTVVKGMIIH